MLRSVHFRGNKYKLVITKHAYSRMQSREISESLVVEIINSGSVKNKEHNPDRYWVYKKIRSRSDNLICLSVVIEQPNLILVTALINWRPKWK